MSTLLETTINVAAGQRQKSRFVAADLLSFFSCLTVSLVSTHEHVAFVELHDDLEREAVVHVLHHPHTLRLTQVDQTLRRVPLKTRTSVDDLFLSEPNMKMGRGRMTAVEVRETNMTVIAQPVATDEARNSSLPLINYKAIVGWGSLTHSRRTQPKDPSKISRKLPRAAHLGVSVVAQLVFVQNKPVLGPRPRLELALLLERALHAHGLHVFVHPAD